MFLVALLFKRPITIFFIFNIYSFFVVDSNEVNVLKQELIEIQATNTLTISTLISRYEQQLKQVTMDSQIAFDEVYTYEPLLLK